MNGEMIEFASNGGTASGYLARPASGRGPALIVIQEWWGLVGHITDLVDRFAEAGFVALAPDLYHGEQAKSPDQAGKLMMALNIAQTARDLRGAVDRLLADKAVDGAKAGVVGFCMGGQLAIFAAQEYPDRIGAVVDFYGVHPSVQLDASRITAPVLAHFATRDSTVTPEVARDLVQRLEAGGVTVEAHYYEADHAFFNDQRPEVYSAADAEVAWQRTVSFLKTSLTS